MGLRNFFRVLFKGPGAQRSRHAGDDFADEMRESLSGSSGWMPGNHRAIYRYLEKRKRK